MPGEAAFMGADRYPAGDRDRPAPLILEFQQRVRIAVASFSLSAGASSTLVEKFAAGRIWREWIIDREHDAVDAERLQRGDEWRLIENPACGDPDLIEDGLGDRAL